MVPLEINATNNTPAILYQEDGKLLIKGRSVPASEAKFYEPVIEWAKKLNVSTLIVEINLEYMNSGSSKMMLTLLKTLENHAHIKKLNIKWYYEEGDEETYEKGKLFHELLENTNFKFCRFRDSPK
jgi:hypothetical protein